MATILIIEDNNDIHEILKDLFETEHRVFSAYSGTEGLLIFAQEKIDLVLLDIMLPGKNGDQVLAEIRKSSQIPVVMLTALGVRSRWLVSICWTARMITSSNRSIWTSFLRV